MVNKRLMLQKLVQRHQKHNNLLRLVQAMQELAYMEQWKIIGTQLAFWDSVSILIVDCCESIDAMIENLS